MSIGRPGARAGIYAEQRYQRGLDNWRRKMTPLLALMFGPFMLAGLIILVTDRQGLSWFAGAIFGICAGVWIWVWDAPPRYIEKWHDGAEGERKTEKALKPLEKAGWSVVHDVQCRYGNYDHIAVGPGGVYLLETKNLQGIVTVQDGVPVLNRRHDPDDIDKFQQVRPRALGAAASVKDEIEQRSGHRIWVQAVVVFWAEFPEQHVEHDRCVYIHGSRLRAWLQEQNARIDDRRAKQVAAAVTALAHEASSHGDDPPSET